MLKGGFAVGQIEKWRGRGLGKKKQKEKIYMKNYTRKKCTQLGQAEKKNKHVHLASQKNFHAEAGLPTPFTFLMVLP